MILQNITNHIFCNNLTESNLIDFIRIIIYIQINVLKLNDLCSVLVEDLKSILNIYSMLS